MTAETTWGHDPEPYDRIIDACRAILRAIQDLEEETQ